LNALMASLIPETIISSQSFKTVVRDWPQEGFK
jgi:hypothetical protein